MIAAIICTRAILAIARWAMRSIWGCWCRTGGAASSLHPEACRRRVALDELLLLADIDPELKLLGIEVDIERRQRDRRDHLRRQAGIFGDRRVRLRLVSLDEFLCLAHALDRLLMGFGPFARRRPDHRGRAIGRALEPIRHRHAGARLNDARREGRLRGIGIDLAALQRIARLREADLDISDAIG